MTNSVVLADDHRVMRRALSTMIDAEPDLEVVAQADDGIECLKKVRAFKPDLLILDLSMPGLGGLEVLQRITDESPRTRTLVLSMHDDDEVLRTVISSGGAGFLHKSAHADQLLLAVRSILAGGVFLLPDQAKIVSAVEGPHSGPPTTPAGRLDALSEREQEVFRLLALGHTNAEVGELLFISSKTVETYKARLCRKLGIRGRAALVAAALELGVLGGSAHPEEE